jgi:hypothetical protein
MTGPTSHDDGCEDRTDPSSWDDPDICDAWDDPPEIEPSEDA